MLSAKCIEKVSTVSMELTFGSDVDFIRFPVVVLLPLSFHCASRQYRQGSYFVIVMNTSFKLLLAKLRACRYDNIVLLGRAQVGFLILGRKDNKSGTIRFSSAFFVLIVLFFRFKRRGSIYIWIRRFSRRC